MQTLSLTAGTGLMASRYLQGMLVGSVLTVGTWRLFGMLVGLVGESGLPVSGLIAAWTFLLDNLGGALFAFVAVGVAYFHYLKKLHGALKSTTLTPLEAKRLTMKLQVFANLFFGIGVLWTAIGMRSALVVALGDLDAETAAQLGAFEILQRLVDGGILVSLSTTIVGGFGGYLMKLAEVYLVGAQLQMFFSELEQQRDAKLLAVLAKIELNTSHSVSLPE